MAKARKKAKEQTAPKGTSFRDRIKEVRKVPARSLKPHPRNWRKHPESQRSALRAVLDEIGIVDTLLAYESRGKLILIDGHLRQDELDQDVNVVVTDLTAKEAEKILLTHDPLAAMATTDNQQLMSLLNDVKTSDRSLSKMLENLAGSSGINLQVSDNVYTQTVDSPVYTPQGKKPAIKELTDQTKTDQLLSEIKAAKIPKGVKQFLTLAAYRHTVFDFRNIAEFYCHATPEVQRLMERSGLVIIDIEQAIENGFVNLTAKLQALAGIEEGVDGA